jgi:hypothetical protein
MMYLEKRRQLEFSLEKESEYLKEVKESLVAKFSLI